jgi:torulene dioxygenase
MNDSATALPILNLKVAQFTEQPVEHPTEQHYKNWPNAGAVSLHSQIDQ